MPELCRLVILADVNRTNFNRTMNLHWAEVRRRHAAAREAARAAWVAAGEPRAEGPVVASFIVRRARRMDNGNILGALKPCLDSVFVDALTPDDSPAWLSLGTVAQEIGREWKGREEIEVVVTVGEAVADCPQTHGGEAGGPSTPAPIVPPCPAPPKKAASARVETDARGLPVCCGQVRAVTMGTGRPRARCACGRGFWRRPGSDVWEKEPG